MATLSSRNRLVASGRRSYATRMLANSVSPPSGGTSRPESSEARAGTRLNELSVCHIWLPALKRLRVSPAGIRRSSASTFARLEISLAISGLRDHRADRRLERPEAAAEGDLRFVVEPLPSEEEHRMRVEGADDALEDVGVDAPDVHADDLDSQERMEGSRFERRAHDASGVSGHFLSLRSSYGAE